MNSNGPNGHNQSNGPRPLPQAPQEGSIDLQTYAANQQAIQRQKQLLRDAELKLQMTELQNEVAFRGYGNTMERLRAAPPAAAIANMPHWQHNNAMLLHPNYSVQVPQYFQQGLQNFTPAPIQPPTGVYQQLPHARIEELDNTSQHHSPDPIVGSQRVPSNASRPQNFLSRENAPVTPSTSVQPASSSSTPSASSYQMHGSHPDRPRTIPSYSQSNVNSHLHVTQGHSSTLDSLAARNRETHVLSNGHSHLPIAPEHNNMQDTQVSKGKEARPTSNSHSQLPVAPRRNSDQDITVSGIKETLAPTSSSSVTPQNHVSEIIQYSHVFVQHNAGSENASIRFRTHNGAAWELQLPAEMVLPTMRRIGHDQEAVKAFLQPHLTKARTFQLPPQPPTSISPISTVAVVREPQLVDKVDGLDGGSKNEEPTVSSSRKTQDGNQEQTSSNIPIELQKAVDPPTVSRIPEQASSTPDTNLVGRQLAPVSPSSAPRTPNQFARRNFLPSAHSINFAWMEQAEKFSKTGSKSLSMKLGEQASQTVPPYRVNNGTHHQPGLPGGPSQVKSNVTDTSRNNAIATLPHRSDQLRAEDISLQAPVFQPSNPKPIATTSGTPVLASEPQIKPPLHFVVPKVPPFKDMTSVFQSRGSLTFRETQVGKPSVAAHTALNERASSSTTEQNSASDSRSETVQSAAKISKEKGNESEIRLALHESPSQSVVSFHRSPVLPETSQVDTMRTPETQVRPSDLPVTPSSVGRAGLVTNLLAQLGAELSDTESDEEDEVQPAQKRRRLSIDQRADLPPENTPPSTNLTFNAVSNIPIPVLPNNKSEDPIVFPPPTPLSSTSLSARLSTTPLFIDSPPSTPSQKTGDTERFPPVPESAPSAPQNGTSTSSSPLKRKRMIPEVVITSPRRLHLGHSPKRNYRLTRLPPRPTVVIKPFVHHKEEWQQNLALDEDLGAPALLRPNISSSNLTVEEQAFWRAIEAGSKERGILRKCQWDSCAAILDTGERLQRHVSLLHHRIKADVNGSFSCLWRGCGKIYMHKKHLKTHISGHCAGKIYCSFKDCTQEYRQLDEMAEHMKEKHHGSGQVRPEPKPYAPQVNSLPPLPRIMPAYLCASLSVCDHPVPRARHMKLGPWVLRNIYGQINLEDSIEQEDSIPDSEESGPSNDSKNIPWASDDYYSFLPSTPSRVSFKTDLPTKDTTDFAAREHWIFAKEESEELESLVGEAHYIDIDGGIRSGSVEEVDSVL